MIDSNSEMFVRAVVESHLAQEGKVMDPNLAGKWTCPMHPSVLKDQAGTCDVCGMDLVSTELGYMTGAVRRRAFAGHSGVRALDHGPACGRIREEAGHRELTFEGRQIVLGPRAGDYYVVKEGLAEGEQVVTNGSFKIDLPSRSRPDPA